MKIFRRMAGILICIMVAGLLGGCASDADAQAYLQALLDASYKNDPAKFVEIRLGTQEEAQALYDQGIDTGVSAFCSRLGISDAYKEEFRPVYMDMLSKVRYEVGKAEKQSDGSFIVTVSYEKMRIFGPALESYQQDVAAKANEWASAAEKPSEEEMVQEIVLQFKKSMESVLSDVQYDEAGTMTVRIELADKVYTPNTDDVAALEKALFDGE